MMAPSLAEAAGVEDDARREALARALELVRSHELHTILISLCDGSGASRVKSFRASDFERIARVGIPYQSGVLSLDSGADFVAGTGFDFELRGGCFLLLPDPATLTPTPWSPGTAVVMGDAYFEGGSPVAATPRHTARRLLAALEARGLEISWGWEFEFYTFRRDASGELEPTTPDGQALHQVRHRQVEPMLDALRRWLAPAGIELDDGIHEYGPGQLEVNFPPGRGLAAIDRAFFFRLAVKEILAQDGIVATFMTKPIQGRAASACHLHQALYDRAGANVFADENDPDGLSDTCRRWMSGQLVNADALTALTTPTVNGYKRYAPNSFAPLVASWDLENRTTLVRVPLGRGQNTRIESRLPEAATIPYIAAAGMIATGMLGLDEPQAADRFRAGNAYESDLPRLPESLGRALDALESAPALSALLGGEFLQLYVTLKRHEIRRFEATISEWERNEYLELS
jgi:glutamine synthetase